MGDGRKIFFALTLVLILSGIFIDIGKWSLPQAAGDVMMDGVGGSFTLNCFHKISGQNCTELQHSLCSF